MMRYIKSLEKDLALNHSMISLGSIMKLNSANLMIP